MIRIGDQVEIHFGAAGRRVGMFVGPKGWSGWDDSPTIISPGLQRDGDGNFDLDTKFGSRVVGIDGFIVAEDAALLDAERDRLVRLARGRHRMTVKLRSEQYQWAIGQASDKINVGDTGYRNGFAWASFQFSMEFANPLKYGAARVFTNGQSGFHRGTFTATPLVTVTGNWPSGYTLPGPGGRQYVVTQPLTTGNTHQVDMRTGRLYRNGAVQWGAVGRAETWGIPEGVMTPLSITGTGTGTASFEVTDTYL